MDQGRSGRLTAVCGHTSKEDGCNVQLRPIYPKELQAFRIPEAFATCVGKLYWVAFVLTGDRQKAQEIILPAGDDVADSRTMFWEWLCTWAVRMVVTSCAPLCERTEQRKRHQRLLEVEVNRTLECEIANPSPFKRPAAKGSSPHSLVPTVRIPPARARRVCHARHRSDSGCR